MFCGPRIWGSDGNRSVVVAGGVALDDHAMDEHGFLDAADSGLVAAADVAGGRERAAGLAVQFAVELDRLI